MAGRAEPPAASDDPTEQPESTGALEPSEDVGPPDQVEPSEAPPQGADEHRDPLSPPSPPESSTTPGPERRTRITAALVAAIVLLTGIGGAEAWYLWGRSDPVTSTSRPIVASTVTTRSVVDIAAQAAVDIISATSQDYDAQVDEAAEKMTSTFADEFRETKTQIKDEFVEAETEVTAEVAEQGVIRADSRQVVALLFLTQNTTRAGTDLNVAQFKVEVTMVRTESGWLVSDLQTQ